MRSNRSRLLFVVGSVAALLSLRAVSGSDATGKDPASKALSIFSDVFSLTRSNYVESVDSKTLLEGAYDGMSDALDAFSFYVPASERAAFRTSSAAGTVGTGIVVARRGGFPYVIGALPGSPADKAGIKPGDLIDTIDGKPVRTAPIWKVRSALDGPDGTTVAVIVFRAGDENRVSLKVPRAKWQAPEVSARWDRDVGIVTIPTIAPATAGQLAAVIDEAGSATSRISCSTSAARSAGKPPTRRPRRLRSSARDRWRASFRARPRARVSRRPARRSGRDTRSS